MSVIVDEAQSGTEPVRLWARDFVLLILANFFIFLAFYCLLPTLPNYARGLRLSDKLIGLIVGIFTIAAVTIRPWSGRAIDIGNRRAILSGALLVFLASFAVYRWAATSTMLLALRVIHGFAWGVLTTVIGTFAADMIPPARRGEGMGYYGMTGSVAMTLGPAMGLWIAGRFGFPLLFFATAAIVLLGALTTLLMRIPASHGKGAGTETGWQRYAEPRAIPLSLLMLLAAVIYGGIVTFIPIYSTHYHLGTSAVFFVIFALSVLVTRPVGGRIYDRLGPSLVVVPGLLLFSGAVALLGAWIALPGYLVAAVLLGVGFGAVQPSFQAMVIDRVPPHRRGAATATLITAMDLGIGLGAIMLGLAGNAWGYPAMYLLSSIPGVLALAGYLFISRH